MDKKIKKNLKLTSFNKVFQLIKIIEFLNNGHGKKFTSPKNRLILIHISWPDRMSSKPTLPEYIFEAT